MAADMSEKKDEPATLSVSAEEEVKLNMEGNSIPDLDLKDRDPNNLHEGVKVRFHDIIGEPDRELYSFDKIFFLSFKVFSLTKLWVYRITSLICALPIAVCCGLTFAWASFCRIWCGVPCLRCCDLELICIRHLWQVLLQSCIAPCFEAWGKIFSSIKITLTKGSV